MHCLLLLLLAVILCACIFCSIYNYFSSLEVLRPYKRECPSRGHVFPLHAPIDGWVSEFSLPWESSPAAQNALVRNKNFSILFWEAISSAAGHVCDRTHLSHRSRVLTFSYYLYCFLCCVVVCCTAYLGHRFRCVAWVWKISFFSNA